MRRRVFGWTAFGSGLALFIAGILADGRISEQDVRALGLLLLVVGLGSVGFATLRRPLQWAYERGYQACLRDLGQDVNHSQLVAVPDVRPVSDVRPLRAAPRL